MEKSSAIMELVSNYSAYTEAEDLNVSAAADAPATTWYCASAAVSVVGTATYELTC